MAQLDAVVVAGAARGGERATVRAEQHVVRLVLPGGVTAAETSSEWAETSSKWTVPPSR
ncbi:hypothetical protein [Streptomyces brasiliscabiei]|uniref:hypothetical protein n=1 Tax=Streptomyces brasiliscabiei TaxID=2736302 RepID=UPI001C119327|nr:hypothetical protein [Streptomyces brasiliscabiei]